MDVTVTLTAEQAMQVQTALGERILKLYAMPRDPDTFEGQVVIAATRIADAALVKVLDALYPPESADEVTAAKARADNARGDHFIFPAGVGK